jgi:hypothetical protein
MGRVLLVALVTALITTAGAAGDRSYQSLLVEADSLYRARALDSAMVVLDRSSPEVVSVILR